MDRESFLKGFEKQASAVGAAGRVVGWVKGKTKAVGEAYSKGKRKGYLSGSGKAPTREYVKETTKLKGKSGEGRFSVGAKTKAALGIGALAGSAAGGAYAHKKYKEKNADPRLSSRTTARPAFYQ